MELLIVGLYNFEQYIAIFYSLTMCRLPSGSNNCYQVGYSSNGTTIIPTLLPVLAVLQTVVNGSTFEFKSI